MGAEQTADVDPGGSSKQDSGTEELDFTPAHDDNPSQPTLHPRALIFTIPGETRLLRAEGCGVSALQCTVGQKCFRCQNLAIRISSINRTASTVVNAPATRTRTIALRNFMGNACSRFARSGAHRKLHASKRI